jgi:hypothetical protein
MGPVPPHLLLPAEDQVDTATRILDYWAPDRVRHDEEGFAWLIRNRLEKDSTHAESKIWWARALSRRYFTVLPDDVSYTAGDTLVVTRQQMTTWIKAQTGAEHGIAREVAVEIDLILHVRPAFSAPSSLADTF